MADEIKIIPSSGSAQETKADPAPALEKPARYKVLRTIELNGVLYLPDGAPEPKKPRSAGNGLPVKVDAIGFIDLTPGQAAQMTLGQVKLAATQDAAPAAPKAKKK